MAELIEQYGAGVVAIYFGIIVIKELRSVRSELADLNIKVEKSSSEQGKTNEFMQNKVSGLEDEIKEFKQETRNELKEIREELKGK